MEHVIEVFGQQLVSYLCSTDEHGRRLCQGFWDNSSILPIPQEEMIILPETNYLPMFKAATCQQCIHNINPNNPLLL
jgi:hypothetical protein